MEAALLQYGPLGIMVIGLSAAVAALWKRNNALADSVTTALVNNTAALTALKESLKND